MKNTIFFILVIVFTGCKNNQQPNTAEKPHFAKSEEVINDNLFKVILDVTISENDRLQLFYVDDMPDGVFSAEKRLAYNVKGKDTPQEIKLTLPRKVFPYKLRLDFGENKIETPVKINSIELKYNSDSIVIDALVLEQFFKPNIYLEKVDSLYLRKTLNGRYDPFLVSTPLLNKKIEIDF
jgi:hypothetical protein